MIDEISIIAENLELKGKLSLTRSQLEQARRQCKMLKEELSKRTDEYYVMVDKQGVEIAWLRHMLQKYKREDGQV